MNRGGCSFIVVAVVGVGALLCVGCAEGGDAPAPTRADAAASSGIDAHPLADCGDGSCDVSRECEVCPTDCAGICGTPVVQCGDGACSGGESCASCAADCGACSPTCGNTVCDAGETCASCAADCGDCAPVCSDGTCDASETCASCPADCGACPAVCGDAMCDLLGGECTTCPTDCPGLCGGGGGSCTHDKCDIGGPLAPDCDDCVELICSLDFYCCLGEWDVSCRNAVFSTCGESCS